MFGTDRVKTAVLAGKFPYKWVFRKVEKPGDYVISREEESSINLKSMKESPSSLP